MAGSADKLNIYKEMLKLDPKSRVFSLLAEELCNAGKWEEAAAVCRKGLRFHPDHYRSRVLLGWALMELGEVDEAGRILMDIYDEIQKNALMFKLLSEFATFSGDGNRAQEFTRIYEAFQDRECIPAGPKIAPGEHKAILEPTQEEVPAPETKQEESPVPESVPEEMPEPEAIAEEVPVPVAMQAEQSSLEATQEEITDMEGNSETIERLDKILSTLAERVESRISGSNAPTGVFSERDKDFIKQTILAEVMAMS
jgi:tetratricopeptide (TPR) repeat protein